MNVLVVAAHPDDEVLGCGGAIARHISQGDKVDILILGDGITSRYSESELKGKNVLEQIEKIKKNSKKASEILGVASNDIKGHYCCRFDILPLLDLTKIIEAKIREIKPKRIYTHSPADANNDHVIVFKATQIATRPLPRSEVKEVLLMEVLSSTEWGFYEAFRPNVYIDISSSIEKKCRAMEAYDEEIREFPHPRSIDGIKTLAKKRGSEVGIMAAEAFSLLRSIE